MLLNFKTKNFKSFKNGFELNMKASLIQDLSFSVTSNLTKKRILTSSVIYGPNASGKTSIIEAMQFFKYLILDGSIENSDRKDSILSMHKEYIPFALDGSIEPVEFEIQIIADDKELTYGLSFDLGQFDSSSYDRKIINEYLIVDDKEVFNRTQTKVDVNYRNISNKDLIKGLNNKNQNNYIQIFNENLDDRVLFLSSHFRTMVSKSIFDSFYNWINKEFNIVNSFSLRNSNAMIESQGLSDYAYQAVKEIGVIGTSLAYKKNEKGDNILYSTFNDGKSSHTIPASFVESFGTLRFLDLFPLILDSLANGGTLVIDELDTSLHPMVIMSIANLYHDPEINLKHAQLIFNTHNPVFMNNKVFRRDEMCFVEKDRDSNISEFYKLSDFMTNSKTPARSTTDYLNNYFLNRYGAIEYVDLSDVFKRVIKEVSSDAAKKTGE